ncbi:hypothetical protein [Pseudonocardia humida]|uniref:Uncharacterized protein n=1 Tax=Pseudonocardia humida TaxID=2800819 RepID=A0ABT1A9P3_9PSEU|nr:hypothetical protein [Pseudonocardia humida]MCO1659754.1 hypothetical protein [Pseudonocardia humida]
METPAPTAAKPDDGNLLRVAAPHVEVHSAGTNPGATLNSLSVQVLAR